MKRRLSHRFVAFVAAAAPVLAIGASTTQLASAAESMGNAPSWVLEIAPGTWARVSLNTPADVDPQDDPKLNPNYPFKPPWAGGSDQEGVIKNWNSGAFATKFGPKGSLLLYGGGHNGYYGNEVYAFDMESRLWTRLTNPYPSPEWNNLDGSPNLQAYPDGWYPDHTPSPPHTYDQAGYHPGTNSFVVLQTQSNNTGNSGRVPRASMLALDKIVERPIADASKAWRFSPINTGGETQRAGAWSAYDAARDVFWCEGGSGTDAFAKFDPKVANADGTFGEWTNYPPKITGNGVAERDPLRDILVVRAGGGRFGHAHVVIDLKNPSGPGVPIETAENPLPGGPPLTEEFQRPGIQWSQKRQAMIWWRRDAEVYELRLLSPDWKGGQWKWSMITAPSNKIVPEPMSVDNGVFKRFRIAAYADAEVAVVINRMDGAVYAFRVPEGGDITQPKSPTSLTVK